MLAIARYGCALRLDRTPFERAARLRPKNSQALSPRVSQYLRAGLRLAIARLDALRLRLTAHSNVKAQKGRPKPTPVGMRANALIASITGATSQTTACAAKRLVGFDRLVSPDLTGPGLRQLGRVGSARPLWQTRLLSPRGPLAGRLIWTRSFYSRPGF